MTMLKDRQDNFSIGSAASGVNITVYFDDIRNKEVVVAKIDVAIELWKNASVNSGRVK